MVFSVSTFLLVVVLVMRGERVCPISMHGQSWLQWVTDSKPIREGPCARLAKKSSPWMNKRNAGNSQEIEQQGENIYIYK